MSIRSRDPRKIHDAYKEAVVDSLLGNLSARVSGRGNFYRVIYGAKPSRTLISEFILPMPATERFGDEESDPIQISAHGLDFQIRATGVGEKIRVKPTGAVYVRILPSAADIAHGGVLEVSFPLNREVERELKAEIKESLQRLADELGSRKHPDWFARSTACRAAAFARLGLPFDSARDRTASDENDIAVAASEGEDDDGEEAAVTTVPQGIPDALAGDVPPPPKWYRIDLALPEFEFCAATAEEDAHQATQVLNASIATQLQAWAETTEGEYPGALWGFRKGLRLRPSHAAAWDDWLAAARASKESVLVPSFDLRWVATSVQDPIDPSRETVHLALENWTAPLNRNNAKDVEPALFQLRLDVSMPASVHAPLHLDRVKPSYRYNRYLSYAALGFNGAVASAQDEDTIRLATTWSPRYVLPRIVPWAGEVELNIERLSKPENIDGLRPLISSYEAWLHGAADLKVDQGMQGPDVKELEARERDKLKHDLANWKSELEAIRTGLEILLESKKFWSGPGNQKDERGIPFEAWLSMNTSMAKVAKEKGYEDWRLFQLAFVLASVPGFATRIPAFHRYYSDEVKRHANSVTLLYFATGGGKSEAFLGLLVYVLFLDRLRGKSRGVTALMRYPLRLLTLQQARRTFATMGAAEEVRFSRGHAGDPFSLGFWVGGSNTPNWHTEEGYSDVPTERAAPPEHEVAYLADPNNKQYKNARNRWLKLSSCPFCGSRDGSALALRRWSGGGNALGHFCTSSKESCSWNARFDEARPLPFYVVDEDIYDLAPSVLLGTIDKLAVLGQSQGTIRKFLGIFGFAPLMERRGERLSIPMSAKEWEGHPGSSTEALHPSYRDGAKKFFDPFPSLLIQDEAHLLDESLGTFAGLFESALEAGFDELAPLLEGQLSHEPGGSKRRKIKVIAASATVSDPQRQMRNLYQRLETTQFPYPGPDLYSSFYAAPKSPDSSSEDQERVALPVDSIETRSHWARVYAGLLTNGHRHTVAMASVLGHYHQLITVLYEGLKSSDPVQVQTARSELLEWVSPGPTHTQFTRLIRTADTSVLLTLVDLHRIALTYVTNKKGGDQVIDTERTQTEKLHREAGFAGLGLSSELISGAVSAADIQEIVRRAEKRVGVDQEFPELSETLRSVIATSAISHGVDVEEFNAMFFAGIPSDIAEYIQASSRVGRTHVGFSLLVPVPQRYRDRFVLEIHDIFHRFLERMILPASIDRWAEKALVRVMPSFFQEFVCGVQAIATLCAAEDSKKSGVKNYRWAEDVRGYLADQNHVKAVQKFMEKALGFGFDPPPEGLEYYKALLKEQVNRYQQDLDRPDLVVGTPLVRFFESRDRLNRPMTSLRDVDLPGLIYESRRDMASARVQEGSTARVMEFIRKGNGADIDSTDERTESKGAG